MSAGRPPGPAEDVAVDPRDDYAMRLGLAQADNAWLVVEVLVGTVIVRRWGR